VAGGNKPDTHIRNVNYPRDPSITLGANLVAGGNKPDTHIRNVNYPRDFAIDLMVDITTARAGEGCPVCGAPLIAKKGVEVGHVFKLGSFFTERMGATFLDRDGVEA